MNFIKEYWIFLVLLFIYTIAEKILSKQFNKIYFSIAVAIIGVVGLILCEVFSIGNNVDLFCVCIITFSIIELLRKFKEKRKENKSFMD